MSSNVGNLPAKLVLDFTTLYQPCSGNVGTQIQQGNTFSVPFDLSQVKYQSGNWNGLVFVMTDAENNFQAGSQIKMAAEGLAGLPPETLVERVAGIWSLIEGIDPEIARRRTRYTTPES